MQGVSFQPLMCIHISSSLTCMWGSGEKSLLSEREGGLVVEMSFKCRRTPLFVNSLLIICQGSILKVRAKHKMSGQLCSCEGCSVPRQHRTEPAAPSLPSESLSVPLLREGASPHTYSSPGTVLRFCSLPQNLRGKLWNRQVWVLAMVCGEG